MIYTCYDLNRDAARERRWGFASRGNQLLILFVLTNFRLFIGLKGSEFCGNVFINSEKFSDLEVFLKWNLDNLRNRRNLYQLNVILTFFAAFHSVALNLSSN